MKKTIALGAAALAAMAMAPTTADAGEIKMGGYYMFRMMDSDDTLGYDITGFDDREYWTQRLQLNMDFIASKNTHAHMVTRVVDGEVVEGADSPGLGVTGDVAEDWDIRQLWLETEAWGVGVKVGNMPITLNDGILVEHDTSSFSTVMLSKTLDTSFLGPVTWVAAAVKVDEGTDCTGSVTGNGILTGNGGTGTGIATGTGVCLGYDGNALTTANRLYENDDDEDLYVLSAIGKYNDVNYQATLAHYVARPLSDIAMTNVSGANFQRAVDDVTNTWAALTVNTMVGDVDVTATGIYEEGFSHFSTSTQQEGGGFLLATRLKGKSNFGSWNAYAVYGQEDFDSITNDNPVWSATWDQGGPGGRDLMSALVSGAFLGETANGTPYASPTNNIFSVGAGVKVKSGAWTINPMLDWVNIVDDDPVGIGTEQASFDSAWGGTVIFSTKIQEATTLSFTGTYVDPDVTGAATARAYISNDPLHVLQATVKMVF